MINRNLKKYVIIGAISIATMISLIGCENKTITGNQQASLSTENSSIIGNKEDGRTVKKEEGKKEDKVTTKKEEGNKEDGRTVKKEESKKEDKVTTKKEEGNKEDGRAVKKEEGKKEDKVTAKKEEGKKEVTSHTNKKAEQTGIEDKIGRTKVAQKTNQIILVNGNELSLFNKSNGKWNKNMSTSARLGYSGLTSSKHEGDGATPVGAYPILYGFGFGSNPNSNLSYKRITNNSYFVDDLNSKQYNTWYEGEGQKGEHMIDHHQYKYGMVIGYNTSHIKGKGSAIFLHCNGNGNTAGCISVSQSEMLNLMKKVNDGAYIIITSSENNLKYY